MLITPRNVNSAYIPTVFKIQRENCAGRLRTTRGGLGGVKDFGVPWGHTYNIQRCRDPGNPASRIIITIKYIVVQSLVINIGICFASSYNVFRADDLIYGNVFRERSSRKTLP